MRNFILNETAAIYGFDLINPGNRGFYHECNISEMESIVRRFCKIAWYLCMIVSSGKPIISDCASGSPLITWHTIRD